MKSDDLLLDKPVKGSVGGWVVAVAPGLYKVLARNLTHVVIETPNHNVRVELQEVNNGRA